MPMMAVICGMPIADMTALLRKTRPKSSVSGKTSSCSGKKYACGIDKIDRRDAVFDGDVLRANYFFRSHRKKRAGFHSRVIGDKHEGAPADFRKPSDRSGAGRATPLLVHFERGVDSQFTKLRIRIDQFCNALTSGEPAFFVLRLDGLRAAALADLFFLILDFRQQIDDAAGVLFEFGRLTIRTGFQDRIRHAKPSRTHNFEKTNSIFSRANQV